MHDNFIKQTLLESAFENNSKELFICMAMYKHPIAWIQIWRNDNRMWNKTY